jgi:epsilon-lactone hydrolase
MTAELNVAADGAITVGPRAIPLPAALSARARQELLQFYKTDSTGGLEHPDPSDRLAWQAFVARVNAAILEFSPVYSIADRPGVTCETQTLGGTTVHVAVPHAIAAHRVGRVYLEVHGGGLVFLEGEGARRGALREASLLGVRTVSVDYRVPPDHPYPAALEDCVAAYRALLATYSPGDIVVGGISGGGNLAAALPLRLREEGIPFPAGVVLLTPEVDLTESGDTFETLMGVDPILRCRLAPQIQAYAPGRDLSDPCLSPLFADFSRGYPPTFLQSGTRDVFLSNTVRMHRALRRAGIRAELHVWEGMSHGGFMGDTDEDAEMYSEIARFMDELWC